LRSRHRRIDDREAMAADAAGASDSRVTREEWRALRHRFFRESLRAPIETRRMPRRKSSVFARLTRIRGQRCRNCGLSLGLAALPEPRESAAPSGGTFV
jgi:hypothetical protein